MLYAWLNIFFPVAVLFSVFDNGVFDHRSVNNASLHLNLNILHVKCHLSGKSGSDTT